MLCSVRDRPLVLRLALSQTLQRKGFPDFKGASHQSGSSHLLAQPLLGFQQLLLLPQTFNLPLVRLDPLLSFTALSFRFFSYVFIFRREPCCESAETLLGFFKEQFELIFDEAGADHYVDEVIYRVADVEVTDKRDGISFQAEPDVSENACDRRVMARDTPHARIGKVFR